MHVLAVFYVVMFCCAKSYLQYYLYFLVQLVTKSSSPNKLSCVLTCISLPVFIQLRDNKIDKKIFM